MSLDTNNTFFQPLTLDGLTTIQADTLNLNVNAGLLQADSFGDIYGSTDISFEPSIQGVTMTNFIRNAITGSTFVDFDKNTGVISISGSTASKWALNITGNVLYPSVAVTGIVAVNSLNVTGAAVFKSNIEVYNPAYFFNSFIANGTSTINGGLDIIPLFSSSGLRVTGNSRFNNNLQIVGNLNVTGSSSFNSSVTILGTLNVTGNVSFNSNVQAVGDVSANRILIKNAKLTSNGNDLFINAGTTSETIYIRPNGDGSAVGQTTFFPQETSIQGGTLTINPLGYLGMGIANATSKFQIVTPDPATNYPLLDFKNTNDYGIYAQTDTIASRGNTLRWMSRDFNSGISTIRDVLTMRPEGNIGIGTNNPQSTLHTYKFGGNELRITTSDNTAARLGMYEEALGATWGAYMQYVGTNDRLEFGHKRNAVDIPEMALDVNGNLCIGTLTGNARLTVSGNFSISGAVTVSGNVSISGAVGISGAITALGDITLGRNNSATVGRLLTFTFGTGNAGAQAQGIEFRDLTTPASNLGIYGFQNTLNFVAGGSQKMTIGANVDFNSPPYVGGSQIDTNDVLEGTNLYFTQARARQSISAQAPISYDNSTGIISLPSANNTYEWRGQANTGTGDKYIFVARLPSGGGCGVQIRGVVGGFFRSETSKIDLAINVRGADAVYGSMETESSTVANVISFVDFVLYTNGSDRDLYIILKSGKWYSYDFVINGQVDCILYTPTTTTVTPVGTVAIASILSNLRVYTIAGQVNIGTSVAETNVLLNVRKASGGIKAKVETASGNDAELWLKNSVSSFAWYAHGSQNSMRLFNYNTSMDLMTISAGGNVGIGITNPTHSLVVNGSQILSGANKSLWLGGETGLGNDGSRFHYAGDGNTYYDCKSSSPNFIWRSNTTNGETERMRLSNAGNLGIGVNNPTNKLEISDAQSTTIKIRATDATSACQLFLQNDSTIAGAGIYLNGSATPFNANFLHMQNNLGAIYILPKLGTFTYNRGRFEIQNDSTFDPSGNSVLQFKTGNNDMGYFFMRDSDNAFVSTQTIYMPSAFVDTTSLRGMHKVVYRREPVVNPLPTTGASVGYNTGNFNISSGQSTLFINMSCSCYTNTSATIQFVSVALFTSAGVSAFPATRIATFFFNQANVHLAFGGYQTFALSGIGLSAGSYYLRVQWGGTGNQTDFNDYMQISVLELPKP
jgi:cytoskeletal protein CcmA (bactofilin family)